MINRLLSYQVGDPEQQRKGRWMNTLLLSFIVMGVLLTIADAANPRSQLAGSLVIDFLTVIFLVGVYLINRRGYLTLAAGGLVVAIAANIIAASFTLDLTLGPALGYPALFALVIVTAGVFLSWRVVVALAAFFSLFTLAYYYGNISPTIEQYRRTDADGVLTSTLIMIVLFVAVGALSWLSSRLIQQTVADLRQRNTQLEEAYQALVTQSQQEHELGASIGNLATELAQVSTRQISGVSDQAESINQIVQTVNELHSAASQIAAITQEVRESAETALVSVESAQTMIGQSREAIRRNRVQVQQVIERMGTLNDLTVRLTGFVNRISALSDETQLLALNATIEAAGAGALGRRFGVVASEVQNLSTHANEIVDQIRMLLRELDQAGQVTRTATQNSIDVADEVEQIANAVRDAQAQVVEAVQRTNQLVQLITTATTQQTAATAQVTTTMHHIAQVAVMTRLETTALERVTGELTQTAERLMGTMSRLRSRVQRV
jgi:methyl-accepting chemotaxis protein